MPADTENAPSSAAIRPRCTVVDALLATAAAMLAGGIGFGASMIGWMAIDEPASLREGWFSALFGFAAIAGIASLPAAMLGAPVLLAAGNRGARWPRLCALGVAFALPLCAPLWFHRGASPVMFVAIAAAGLLAGGAAAAVLRLRCRGSAPRQRGAARTSVL